MLNTSKFWLEYENKRNAVDSRIYTRLLKRAFGQDMVVMAGHHFMLMPAKAMDDHDLSQSQELPSADTVIFDHDIMKEVFGEDAYIPVMEILARTPCAQRDMKLEGLLNKAGVQ